LGEYSKAKTSTFEKTQPLMKSLRLTISIAILCISQSFAFSQNRIEVVVKDSATSETLVGVSILLKGTSVGTTTNATGMAHFNNIPNGSHTLVLSLVGYKKKEVTYSFPLGNVKQPIAIVLSSEAEQLEEVTVSATRNNSRIEDLPTKTEVLGQEDMVEENGIKPSSITSLLGDIAGIQMQQTSTASGNMDARIQGLNGRYSQILRDGMPLYGGFSGSFSILQIPPIDLKQIEIIKGSSSTLYGGGAIGGIINLVSKQPTLKPETNLLINQTTLKESDFNTYISRKYDKVGFTYFTGVVYQNAVDVNSDGFSDVPRVRNLTVHPKLYYYFDRNTTLSVGFNGTYEKREGGDMQVIRDKADANHQYFVNNRTSRNVGELSLEKKYENGSMLTFKGSASYLHRNIENPSYLFSANQCLYFSELSYFLKKESHDFVFGANFNGDSFNKDQATGISIPNYSYSTVGLFAQNDWRITNRLLVESGLRYDYHNHKGGYLLPRLSVMYKLLPKLSVRINGGLGYKVPVIFDYIDEERDLNQIISNQSSLKTEKSQGVNCDLNFDTRLWNTISLTLNQSFFYTLLNHPVVYSVSNNQVTLTNADKSVETSGAQSYARLSYKGCELYVSYVYTHTVKNYDKVEPWFLATPEHNLAMTFMVEPSEDWRLGIESSYIGRQHIENFEKSPNYLLMAAMIQRNFNKISIVLNCENLLDYRQKNYLILPASNPSFKTLWAPIDGRVINLSVNIKL
jgi:outer membrane receptor for ferrienterochelin and colicin